MSGFWITLYKNNPPKIDKITDKEDLVTYGEPKIVIGYLYCCDSTDCVVTRVKQKSELEVCPKCGESIILED